MYLYLGCASKKGGRISSFFKLQNYFQINGYFNLLATSECSIAVEGLIITDKLFLVWLAFSLHFSDISPKVCFWDLNCASMNPFFFFIWYKMVIYIPCSNRFPQEYQPRAAGFIIFRFIKTPNKLIIFICKNIKIIIFLRRPNMNLQLEPVKVHFLNFPFPTTLT